MSDQPSGRCGVHRGSAVMTRMAARFGQTQMARSRSTRQNAPRVGAQQRSLRASTISRSPTAPGPGQGHPGAVKRRFRAHSLRRRNEAGRLDVQQDIGELRASAHGEHPAAQLVRARRRAHDEQQGSASTTRMVPRVCSNADGAGRFDSAGPCGLRVTSPLFAGHERAPGAPAFGRTQDCKGRTLLECRCHGTSPPCRPSCRTPG
jgi:hypothetical protein